MIRLAVIGTGGMANAQVKAFHEIKGVKIVAACDIDEKRVKGFAEKHGIPLTYTDYNELLDKVELDAVTNVTSDPYHAPISLAVIQKGLHILCEKPLALNYADAKKMTDAARRRKVINMVQFSYRKSAALQKARELVAAGELGEIVHFEASYLQSWISSKVWGDWKTSPAWLWRQSTAHGSKGVLGDVGVHVIDFATYPIGSPIRSLACKLKTFNALKGRKHAGYTLDANDSAVIQCELANGALGVIHTSRWATGKANSVFLRVHGTKGAFEIDLDKSYDTLQVCLGKDADKAVWKSLNLKPTPNNYARFARSVQTGKNDQPDFARGAEIQKVLDRCFDSDKAGKPVRV